MFYILWLSKVKCCRRIRALEYNKGIKEKVVAWEGDLMNISVNHRAIRDFNELAELVTDAVANFCVQWKKGLDELLDENVRLLIYMRRYGYEVKYHFENGRLNWLFQLELYYPNQSPQFERKITYIKIHKFATLPMYQGNGSKVFEHLLNCTQAFGGLSMIRLRSVRTAVSFWKKQGFQELEKTEELALNQDCEKIPQMLKNYKFVYVIKPCNCNSCQSYH